MGRRSWAASSRRRRHPASTPSSSPRTHCRTSSFPSGYPGIEYEAAAIGSYYNVYDPQSPTLSITGPDIGYGTSNLQLDGHGCIHLLAFGINAPKVSYSGALWPEDNWGSGTSYDGVWIQDRDDLSKRWKLYFASDSKKLWLRNGNDYFGIVLA